jgi:hypothetical protein
MAPVIFIVSLSGTKTYREITYEFTHFLTKIFGQFHAPATLFTGRNPFNKSVLFPELVLWMWLAVLSILHWSVHSGMCSTAS